MSDGKNDKNVQNVEINNIDKVANLTPEEIKALAAKLAKDMVALADIRIDEQALQCVMCGVPRATHVTLLGGYSTTLCQHHRNEWHALIIDSAAFVAYESAGLRLDIAIRKGAEPEALTYAAGKKAAQKDLYDLAKGWIEAGA